MYIFVGEDAASSKGMDVNWRRGEVDDIIVASVACGMGKTYARFLGGRVNTFRSNPPPFSSCFFNPFSSLNPSK